MSDRKWISVCLAIAAHLVVGAQLMAFPVTIFKDTFDSETTGSFPSTWTNVFATSASQTVVTDALAPTQTKSFQIDNPNNVAYETHRPFAGVALTQDVRFEYDLLIVTIPNG